MPVVQARSTALLQVVSGGVVLVGASVTAVALTHFGVSATLLAAAIPPTFSNNNSNNNGNGNSAGVETAAIATVGEDAGSTGNTLHVADTVEFIPLPMILVVSTVGIVIVFCCGVVIGARLAASRSSHQSASTTASVHTAAHNSDRHIDGENQPLLANNSLPQSPPLQSQSALARQATISAVTSPRINNSSAARFSRHAVSPALIEGSSPLLNSAASPVSSWPFKSIGKASVSEDRRPLLAGASSPHVTYLPASPLAGPIANTTNVTAITTTATVKGIALTIDPAEEDDDGIDNENDDDHDDNDAGHGKDKSGHSPIMPDIAQSASSPCPTTSDIFSTKAVRSDRHDNDSQQNGTATMSSPTDLQDGQTSNLTIVANTRTHQHFHQKQPHQAGNSEKPQTPRLLSQQYQPRQSNLARIASARYVRNLRRGPHGSSALVNNSNSNSNSNNTKHQQQPQQHQHQQLQHQQFGNFARGIPNNTAAMNRTSSSTNPMTMLSGSPRSPMSPISLLPTPQTTIAHSDFVASATVGMSSSSSAGNRSSIIAQNGSTLSVSENETVIQPPTNYLRSSNNSSTVTPRRSATAMYTNIRYRGMMTEEQVRSRIRNRRRLRDMKRSAIEPPTARSMRLAIRAAIVGAELAPDSALIDQLIVSAVSSQSEASTANGDVHSQSRHVREDESALDSLASLLGITSANQPASHQPPQGESGPFSPILSSVDVLPCSFAQLITSQTFTSAVPNVGRVKITDHAPAIFRSIRRLFGYGTSLSALQTSDGNSELGDDLLTSLTRPFLRLVPTTGKSSSLFFLTSPRARFMFKTLRGSELDTLLKPEFLSQYIQLVSESQHTGVPTLLPRFLGAYTVEITPSSTLHLSVPQAPPSGAPSIALASKIGLPFGSGGSGTASVVPPPTRRSTSGNARRYTFSTVGSTTSSVATVGSNRIRPRTARTTAAPSAPSVSPIAFTMASKINNSNKNHSASNNNNNNGNDSKIDGCDSELSSGAELPFINSRLNHSSGNNRSNVNNNDDMRPVHNRCASDTTNTTRRSSASPMSMASVSTRPMTTSTDNGSSSSSNRSSLGEPVDESDIMSQYSDTDSDCSLTAPFPVFSSTAIASNKRSGTSSTTGNNDYTSPTMPFYRSNTTATSSNTVQHHHHHHNHHNQNHHHQQQQQQQQQQQSHSTGENIVSDSDVPTKMTVILIANVFDTSLPIHERFDFKGSSVGRWTLSGARIPATITATTATTATTAITIANGFVAGDHRNPQFDTIPRRHSSSSLRPSTTGTPSDFDGTALTRSDSPLIAAATLQSATGIRPLEAEDIGTASLNPRAVNTHHAPYSQTMSRLDAIRRHAQIALLANQSENATTPATTTTNQSALDAPTEAAIDVSRTTLKEIDFQRRVLAGISSPIRIGPIWRELLLERLNKDMAFLQQFQLMDYSLLVGVHRRDKCTTKSVVELHRGNQSASGYGTDGRRRDQRSKVTAASLRRYGSSGGSLGGGQTWSTGISALPSPVQRLNMQRRRSAHGVPFEDGCTYDDCDGGDGCDHGDVYFFGLVDVLQRFTYFKLLERSLKYTDPRSLFNFRIPGTTTTATTASTSETPSLVPVTSASTNTSPSGPIAFPSTVSILSSISSSSTAVATVMRSETMDERHVQPGPVSSSSATASSVQRIRTMNATIDTDGHDVSALASKQVSRSGSTAAEQQQFGGVRPKRANSDRTSDGQPLSATVSLSGQRTRLPSIPAESTLSNGENSGNEATQDDQAQLHQQQHNQQQHLSLASINRRLSASPRTSGFSMVSNRQSISSLRSPISPHASNTNRSSLYVPDELTESDAHGINNNTTSASSTLRLKGAPPRGQNVFPDEILASDMLRPRTPPVTSTSHHVSIDTDNPSNAIATSEIRRERTRSGDRPRSQLFTQAIRGPLSSFLGGSGNGSAGAATAASASANVNAANANANANAANVNAAATPSTVLGGELFAGSQPPVALGENEHSVELPGRYADRLMAFLASAVE
ncbi:hypothetical protein GQ42DRAFT_60554 [Ramicandelaber brevisporus]|nr:hypothetical protein GQ42DRAFT_60554 [Ramicandelaber brevisporus]